MLESNVGEKSHEKSQFIYLKKLIILSLVNYVMNNSDSIVYSFISTYF